MERNNGQIVAAKPYMDNIQLDQGIDQKTGKPIDYDPIQGRCSSYAGAATPTQADAVKRLCPQRTGGNNYWPSSFSPKTKLLYIPAMTAARTSPTAGSWPSAARIRAGSCARWWLSAPSDTEQSHGGFDPFTGDVKKTISLRYPNYTARSRPAATRLHRTHGWHCRSLRRHHARRGVEGQCRLRLCGGRR